MCEFHRADFQESRTVVDFAWYSAIQGGQGEPENFVLFERSELIAIKNFMEHS